MDNSVNSAEPNQEEPKSKKHHHVPPTRGLKIFDAFLYPIFTNVSVFAISVAATYLTSRGADRDATGKLRFGRVGEFFQNRGKWLVDKLKSVGMSESQADMSKMVAFSFIDGSIMAPFVKMFEDRREKIGRFLDDLMGTKPDDDSVYKEEPKQTWLSVLGGRFITAAIVVPTAVALDKTGLNDKLFNNPGLRAGEWLSEQPAIVKASGNLDLKELSRIGFFEAFYTSVCTFGLYISSRFIARKTNSNNEEETTYQDKGEPVPNESTNAKPTKSFAHEGLKKTTIQKHLDFKSHCDKSDAEMAL